ncbi:hypothetical protein GCM10010252_19180 [Streptomyces aureoverticillatus]|nr:hypothetical protein GCM10010252_19180 [Streptomyces aureoverticillatus]
MSQPKEAHGVEGLLDDQLRALFDSPLGRALREYLWTLLDEEVTRLHASGTRSAAHTAGGVMLAQRVVLPEKTDDWSADRP